MGTKSEQKQKTREAILASAGALLRTCGISAMSIAEVMRGAGLTVGGFYGHFASKGELVEAVLRQAVRQMWLLLFADMADRAPAERIELLLRRYLSAAHRDQGELGCPLPAVVGEVANAAPEQRHTLSELIDQFARAVEEQLAPTAGLPRRQHALALVTLMVGGLSLARALRGLSLSDEVLRACRAYGRALSHTGGRSK